MPPLPGPLLQGKRGRARRDWCLADLGSEAELAQSRGFARETDRCGVDAPRQVGRGRRLQESDRDRLLVMQTETQARAIMAQIVEIARTCALYPRRFISRKFSPTL
jgi:hypothetical protein